LSAPPTAPLAPLSAAAFPETTPLHAFFAWNEGRLRRDRRYLIARDIDRLTQPLGGEAAVAARQIADSLRAAIGNSDVEAHAAVFRAFETLARRVDLAALAGRRPRLRAAARADRPREVLIVKLGALGDFIQALATLPDIRRDHGGDRITLLTTAPYAALAAQTGLFDDVLVDRRPRALDLAGWLALRRMLRRRRFDRVYDFQTTERTNFYAWLLGPGPMPEWSGTAGGCSHPHANLARDSQHTMDRQAEQLLMAGIWPVALAPALPAVGALPPALCGRRFALLIAGSSPRHPAKRWPAARYGELARRLLARTRILPVAIGVAGEADIARTIRDFCPETLDLVGRTDIATLGALANAATITVGNDTGATHVAAAGGHPVVVLFSRASQPALCAPRGKAVRVLTRPDLAELPVDAVLSACLAAIGAEPSSAAAG
jgi:ADP-heptose:LPS heptosyltransferase